MLQTFEEYSQYMKDKWWQLNKRQFFAIKVKKTCYQCGNIFTCEQCYIEYWLCERSNDWKCKTECLCPDCLKKELSDDLTNLEVKQNE